MKRNSKHTVTYRNRHDEKCKHAAHARHNVEAKQSCNYHDHQKAHDCTCPRCGRSTRPNMFVCPHCGMHIATVQENVAKRAVQAEVRIASGLRTFKQGRARKCAQPVPQKRQRYMSEETAARLAATIPTIPTIAAVA